MPHLENTRGATVVRVRHRQIGLPLCPGKADLWLVNLDQHLEELDHLEATLSADEIHRIGRFRQPLLRARRIVAHAAVRSVLADYLGGTPGELKFEYGERGKPFLADESLQFSFSYGDDIALCAVAVSPIGVDVERVRPGAGEPWLEALAPEAWRRIRLLPPAERSRGFVRAWTRMEAMIKAADVPLDCGLAMLSRLVAPAADRMDFPEAGGEAESRSWHLRDLASGPDHVGALASPALNEVRIYCWPGTRVGSAAPCPLQVLPGPIPAQPRCANDSRS